MTEKNTIWESAGKAGLVLGGISILYLACSTLLSRISGGGFAIGLLSMLLWLAKFVACIRLMRFFMLRFSQADPSADNSRVFRFGMLSALLSSLLYAAAYLAYSSFIAPDMFAEALEILRDTPMADAASIEKMEEMLPYMPTAGFFANLVYCWLFGTILAAIFSRNIPPRDPFKQQ